MHQLLTLVVFLLDDPIPALITVVGEGHEWVGTAGALIETIVHEAWVALTDGLGALLEARAMSITIDGTTQIKASVAKLTETISIAIVALFALRAVRAREVWMTVALVLAFSLFTFQGAEDVTFAATRANLQVETSS